MSGRLTARTLLTLIKKKYEIRTTEGSHVTEMLLLPNKFNEDQLKLYIYIYAIQIHKFLSQRRDTCNCLV